MSVWAAILEHASQDDERGSVDDFDCETIDALYGYDDGVCERVVSVMTERGMIANGCVAAWQRRQLKDEGAAERKRIQREREKLEQERAKLKALRHEMSLTNQCDTIDVTACHEMSQPVTKCHLEQNRTEKKREEKNPPTPRGGEARVSCPEPDVFSHEPCPEPVASTTHAAIAEAVADTRPVVEANFPDIGFVQLLDAYPEHRRDERAAWRQWLAVMRQPDRPGLPALLDGLTRWLDSDDWQRDGGKYIPRLSNWLAGCRWAERPRQARASPSGLISEAECLARIERLTLKV